MDPNQCLREALALARRILLGTDSGLPVDPDDAAGLAERICNLTIWLAHGGFPPDWSRIDREPASAVSRDRRCSQCGETLLPGRRHSWHFTRGCTDGPR
jgi:hypothetical protein